MPYSLGKKPVKVDNRTFKLSKYLQKEILPSPPRFSCQAKVTNWGMMLNDIIGDCTVAAAGHKIQQWTTYANTPQYVPSDMAILRAYEAVGGYVPGRPETDNGAYMLDVLRYWRKNGIGGRKIVAFALLDKGNVEELKAAISIFGNAYLGLELPLTAQWQSVWSVPAHGPVRDGEPGSWGGHAVPAVMYSERAIGVITWGELLYMTPRFYRHYCSEAYAIVSEDWLKDGCACSPTGFDMESLLADLRAVAT